MNYKTFYAIMQKTDAGLVCLDHNLQVQVNDLTKFGQKLELLLLSGAVNFRINQSITFRDILSEWWVFNKILKSTDQKIYGALKNEIDENGL